MPTPTPSALSFAVRDLLAEPLRVGEPDVAGPLAISDLRS
jgi:hypothetical protein